MAEDLSPLELVPRGVEGTGKAVVLGNEPVVQSLARLSSRMDNLQRLKLLAAQKKQEKAQKEEYDKTPFPKVNVEGGLFGAWNSGETQHGYNRLLKDWNSIENPTVRNARIGEEELASVLRNQFVKDVKDRIPEVQKGMYDLGYNTPSEALVGAESQYLSYIDESAKKLAQQNNITDPEQIRGIRNKLLTQSGANNFISFYAESVKAKPENIDLNRFGDRFLKSIDKTSRFVQNPAGQEQEVNRSNIKNEDGTINYDIVKLGISGDSEDSRMLETAMKPYMLKAAQSIDKPAADAATKLANNNYNMAALTEDEQKQIKEKVRPKAQEFVIDKMFAGKGEFATRRALQTTAEKKKAESKAELLAGQTGGFVNSQNMKVTTYAVAPDAQGREKPLLDRSGNPIILDLPKVNLGSGYVLNLAKGDQFEFFTGTPIYFTNAVPPEIKEMFGTRKSDGSYVTDRRVTANSAVVLNNPIHVSRGNVVLKGKNQYLPKGTIVNPGTYNSEKLEKNWAVVDVNDIDMDKMIDNYVAGRRVPGMSTQEQKDNLKKKLSGLTGLRIIIDTSENPQFKAKFDNMKQDIEMQKSNSSLQYIK